MILISCILTAFILWLLLKYFYSYWERKQFPFIRPSIPFGNLLPVAKREKSFGIGLYDLYNSTKKPFVGIYLFFRPAILIRDPELVKNILTKDFTNFHDRGVYVDEDDPISGNLFALKGSKWRNLRAKLTPAFTSGKLKNMFKTIEDIAKGMENYLNSILPEEGEVIDLKDVSSKYAMDIIASVIFGVEVNSFTNPNNVFQQQAIALNNPGIRSTLAAVGTFICPKLIEMFPFLRGPSETVEFLVRIVRETIEYREKNNVSRKDFMQLLLQLRNTGKVGDDGIWNVETEAEDLKSMSIEQCASQLFVFWIAGFETSSSTMAFCLYELSQNSDLMQRVTNEMNEALERHNGQLTYECIQDMKYLDLCIMETIRKYPGLPILNRECTEKYEIPDSPFTIEKGTPIIIPLMGLHRDPNYFPDPLKFNPDRFLEEHKNYNENAYFPFGDGPRACIGIRLGKMNVKVGIVTILSKFNIEISSKKEIEFDNYAVALVSKGGVPVRISKKKILF